MRMRSPAHLFYGETMV